MGAYHIVFSDYLDDAYAVVRMEFKEFKYPWRDI